MDTFDRFLIVLMIFGCSTLTFIGVDYTMEKRFNALESALEIKK